MNAIGFIGLGHMGHPMVRNLIKAGHLVKVYDVQPAAIASAVKDGATAAESISGLVKDVDIVITSVQTGQQVKDICHGDAGLFAQARVGTLFIDCSSIDIESTNHLHQEAETYGINMLDAPVSGGVKGAETASLTFMVGGTEETFARALPILQAMGKKIVYAGRAGCGQAAKICNNLILGISMVGVCEGFNLAQKLGLDAKKFFEVSSNASGQCWAMTSYCPAPGVLENVPSSHEYQPGFTAKMMLKDLRLAFTAAESVDALIPLGEVTTELYEMFVKAGGGERDFSAMMQLISE